MKEKTLAEQARQEAKRLRQGEPVTGNTVKLLDALAVLAEERDD